MYDLIVDTHRLKSMVLFLVSFIILVTSWAILYSTTIFPTYILPNPFSVFASLFNYRIILFYNGLYTYIESMLSFMLAVVIGCLFAVVFHYKVYIKIIFYPYIIGLQAFPKESLAPLFLIWFGYGILSKIVIGFLIAVFPIVVGFLKGLEETPVDFIEEIRVWGPSEWFLFKKIRVWAAIPHLISACKVSITLSFIGAVVGEFIGSNKGLGYLINLSQSQMNLNLLFAALVVLFMISLGMFIVLSIIERYINKLMGRP